MFYSARTTPILNAQAIDDLHELIQGTPSLFLDEIGEWLALYHDQPISTTALHYNLRELGLTCKVMRRAAVERDPVAHAEWLAYVMATYTADQMVILNESSKDGRSLMRRYGHALSGEDPVVSESIDCGIRNSILPALMVDGYIAVCIVEGPSGN